MTRKHPFTCTGCGHGFDAFRQLRKHWDGSCTACQPLAASTTHPQPLIDPTRSLWLNDDDFPLLDNYSTDYNTDYSTDIDDDDVITILDDDHPHTIPESDEPLRVYKNAPAHAQEDSDVKKELLFELLRIVDMLSTRILKLEHTPDWPAPTTSAQQSTPEKVPLDHSPGQPETAPH